MSNEMTFREKVRTVEKLTKIATPDLIEQINIISNAQAQAVLQGKDTVEAVFDILSIAKRRIIRKAGQS